MKPNNYRQPYGLQVAGLIITLFVSSYAETAPYQQLLDNYQNLRLTTQVATVIERYDSTFSIPSGEYATELPQALPAAEPALAPSQTLPKSFASRAELLAYAFDHNPGLLLLDRKKAANRQRYSQATYLQDLQLSYSALTQMGPGGMMAAKGPSEYPLPSVRTLRLSQVQLREQLIDAQAEDQKRVIRTNIDRELYRHWVQTETLVIFKESLVLAEHIHSLVTVQYNTGKVPLTNLWKIESALADLKTKIANQGHKLAIIQAGINRSLSLPASHNAELPPPIRFANAQKLTTQTRLELLQHPQVRALALEQEQLVVTIAILQKMSRPDYFMGTSLMRTPSVKAMKQAPAPPIRPWFAYQEATILELRELVKAKDAAITKRCDQLEHTLLKTGHKILILQQELKLIDTELLPLANDSIEVIESEYIAGRQQLTELLEAYDHLLSLRLKYLRKQLATYDGYLLLARHSR